MATEIMVGIVFALIVGVIARWHGTKTGRKEGYCSGFSEGKEKGIQLTDIQNKEQLIKYAKRHKVAVFFDSCGVSKVKGDIWIFGTNATLTSDVECQGGLYIGTSMNPRKKRRNKV